MAKTVAIVQARMGSTRLPGKVLMPLGRSQVLSWVHAACARAVGIDETWIATSTLAADYEIVEWCDQHGIKWFRGSEIDVLDRFAGCCDEADADVILRLTGDCPFLDPRVISEVIELRKRTGAAYASNVDPRTYPDGLDVECFTREALEVACEEATNPIDRDTVTYWIRRNRSRFPAANLTCQIPGMQHERWVLDTEKDYEFCQAIAKNYIPGGMVEILEILDKHPEFREINNPSGTNPGMNERFYDALAMEEVRPRTYHRSQQLLERAETIIPLGAQTFSKSKLQFPQPAASFLSHGDGPYVWDADGNEYVDCMSALLPVVLGYRDPDIDGAIRRQLDAGISFSLATEIEHELASKLVELIPCAEMVRFGKTGTDATTAAVRLARAFTERDCVVACGGYHGWADWSVERNTGVPMPVRAMTVRVPFGSTDWGPGYDKIAAIIVEPETDPSYLRFLREYCTERGILLIFDEVITGFRFSLGGAQKLFGVTPDLACFGKSMANGMPISAVVGRRDIMMKMVPPDNIFYSGTFFGETLSIAAAIATIKKMERENVVQKLESIGLHLALGVNRLLLKYGLDEYVSISGHGSLKRLKFKDDRVAALFRKEMMASGTLTIASNNVMASLDAKACRRVLRSYDWTFDKIKQVIEKGEFEVGEISGGVR